MIFGANVTGAENGPQLALDGRYPLVIYGWQHEDNASDWTDVGTSLSEQCTALKASGATSLCVVYRSAANSMPWFSSDAAVMRNATKKETWFMRNPATGAPLSDGPFHPDPHWPVSQTWFWEFRNPEVQDYFATTVVDSVLSVEAVDGIFFDMVDYMVCGAFEFAPCDPVKPARVPCGLSFPGGVDGERAYFDAVWSTMKRVAEKLADHGKLGVFSSTNFMRNLSWAPEAPQRMEPGRCIKPQDTANAIMGDAPWARYYEQWVDGNAPRIGTTSLIFNRSQCAWQIQNALLEAESGIATAMHTDIGPMWMQNITATPALIAVDTALAAFLITASLSTPSFYGFSFGSQWYDSAYHRIPSYDREIGRPLGLAKQLGCCDGELLPHTYAHDAEGHHDLFNTPTSTAETCASLCCSLSACAGFQWTSSQAGAAGNCSAGDACCWIKPTIGRLEHWTYNATPGSLEYNMVSGAKRGLTFQRQFEHATVNVHCSQPSGSIDFKTTG